MLKKIIIVVILLFVSVSIFAQLNTLATTVKESMPETYANMKKHAVENWVDDQKMIVHEINTQALSFAHVVSMVNDINNIVSIEERQAKQAIAFNALLKWSHDDYDTTIELFSTGFINVDADWQMVEYEMEKQLEAYGTY